MEENKRKSDSLLFRNAVIDVASVAVCLLSLIIVLGACAMYGNEVKEFFNQLNK